VTKQTEPADSEIHEDQLLNVLTGAFTLSLGENAEIDPEDIFEVLVGATADGTSISTLCEKSEDAPSANDVLYHLRTKFDLETVESTGNTLLQQDVLETLPEQVEVVADLPCGPTTVTKTRLTASTTARPKQEQLRSTLTPHSTPA